MLKLIFIFAALFSGSNLLFSQDTAVYSFEDLNSVLKIVQQRDSLPEIQNMISRSRELESRFSEIKKSYSGKMNDTTSVNELKKLGIIFRDSIYGALNLTPDSVNAFRKNFQTAEKLVTGKIGAFKQIHFLLIEKIEPSLCRYLQEFYDRNKLLHKSYFEVEK